MKRLPGLSQHFLRNPQFVKSLLAGTKIGAQDVVYDLGAGSGVITTALADIVKQVMAVELDDRMVIKLRENFAAAKNVTIQHADVTKMPLPRTPYKVFANIPFSLSSQIVQRLCDAPNPPAAM